uniref:interactor protein for cytohesin exchange factors 1 n=1 Tax=Scatophagus argus TaxID=75038 RepID=UPI001ED7E6DB|nr:interactor protein for cytohesin exchange factors 1 [Scatophagus argus]
MSIDGTKLLFEGFLQKRKDTMKMRWVTYWFRLQNTTLFFYTKKNGSASHLKGNYYIYTVQSVREVQTAGSKRFMFEIIMTNGKRKLLAAETAALRQEWVGHLWQAMHLSTSRVSNSHLEAYEQREREDSSSPTCSHSVSVTESLPARPLSALTGHEIRSVDSHIFSSEELNSADIPISPQWSSGLSKEGDYDVLPARRKICDISDIRDSDEGVYDFPLSYKRAAEYPDPTESIYDVPSSLLRTMSDWTLEEQQEDRSYWMI